MSVKERVAHELETLSPGELHQVVLYVARLKQQRTLPRPEVELAALYREAADEDRALAQMGLTDYALAREDTL